jgi:hypothetical protein
VIRRAFLDAAVIGREVVASREVAVRWEEPSALPYFSVRGLAGHLVRATTSVEAYLDREEPTEEPLSAAQYYASVLDGAHDLDSPFHQAIRQRGEDAAAEGHPALVESFDAALARLAPRLAEERANRVVKAFLDRVLTLDEYLVTRIIELLVHTDDLAVSVGLPPPDFPLSASRPAIAALVDVAILRHGDEAVLRALTRRERDLVDALRVL